MGYQKRLEVSKEEIIPGRMETAFHNAFGARPWLVEVVRGFADGGWKKVRDLEQKDRIEVLRQGTEDLQRMPWEMRQVLARKVGGLGDAEWLVEPDSRRKGAVRVWMR